MTKLIGIFIMIPLMAVAEEDTAAASGQACTDALEKAKKETRDYMNQLNTTIATSSQPLQPGVNQGGVQSTGNPFTDMSNQLMQLNSQEAEIHQKRIDALGQVEDNCMQQNEQISDNENKSLIMDIRRNQEIANAEAQKLQQDAEIQAQCAREAAQNFQAEVTRLQGYQARIVSNVGAATQSRGLLDNLQNDFYNRCWNSQATQISLDSNRQALEIKMRNFITEAQAVAAEREYLNVKRSRLAAHCQLQVERADAKHRLAADALKQQKNQAMMGMTMALMTSQAGAQQQSLNRESFMSLDQLLMPANWEQLVTKCMNMGSAASDSYGYNVPADVVSLFSEVNTACRPEGATNTTCVTSSGQHSAERQRANGTGTVQ